MKYIFGITKKGIENLKTTGERTNYSGEIQLVTEYDDAIITDSCEIVEKYCSAEDIEGNCYDWYEVANHNRHIEHKEFETPKDEIIISDEVITEGGE